MTESSGPGGGTILTLVLLAVGAYVLYTVFSGLSGIGSGIGAIGSDIGNFFGGVGSAVTGAVSATGAWFGTLGGVLDGSIGVTSTSNEQTLVQEATSAAKNEQATQAENSAVSQVDYVATTTNGNTSYSTTDASSSNWNEVQTEVGNYDPTVAPYLTLSAYQTMIANGVSQTQVNQYANALQAAPAGSWQISNVQSITAVLNKAYTNVGATPPASTLAFANSLASNGRTG